MHGVTQLLQTLELAFQEHTTGWNNNAQSRWWKARGLAADGASRCFIRGTGYQKGRLTSSAMTNKPREGGRNSFTRRIHRKQRGDGGQPPAQSQWGWISVVFVGAELSSCCNVAICWQIFINVWNRDSDIYWHRPLWAVSHSELLDVGIMWLKDKQSVPPFISFSHGLV